MNLQEKMAKVEMNIQEKIAEKIIVSFNRYLPHLNTTGEKVAKECAAEIMALLEAEDKTLTLMASEAGIPLYRAMKIADYGKKAAMAKVAMVGEEYLAEIEAAYKEIGATGYYLGGTVGVKELLRRLE